MVRPATRLFALAREKSFGHGRWMPRCTPRFLILLLVGVASRAPAADQNWAGYLGDDARTHYSTLNQINRANVARLQPAWTYHAGDVDPQNLSQMQCNPLVIDGVLYGTSPALTLFALDAATGVERWRFTPPAAGGSGLCRGFVWWSQGDERRLFFGAGHFLFAIDPATGRPISSFGDGGKIDVATGLERDVTGLEYSLNTPGAIYHDLLIVTCRVGEGPAPSAPGHIRAFDVHTGAPRWIFHTIPQPEEAGYESWSPDAWQRAGGANCWAGLTIDQKRGIAFIPTGSAAFDFWGGNRIGRNLYADCLLALDAATGKLRWSFQFTHHDIWDRDPPAPPVLCEVERNGRKIAAVAQTTKTGYVWVFDRETGESLFPWREQTVPASSLPDEQAWPTQPYPTKPAPYARQVFTGAEITNLSPEAHEAVRQRLAAVNPHRWFDPPSEKGTIIFPGFDGGAEWGGPAVDPDGVLYVNSNEMAWILEMVPTAAIAGNTAPAALYSRLCSSCHGPNREGNTGGSVPSLLKIGERLKADDIIKVLSEGRKAMPSFGFLYRAQKVAIAAWLLDPAAPPPPMSAAEMAAADTRRAQPNFTGGRWTTTGYNRFFDPNGYPAVKPPWGTLSAIDLNTGDYRWTIRLGELPELTAKGIAPTGTENYGGPIITAGGLLFIGATKDEKFRAFDLRDGAKLWEFALPAGGYATPATYSVNGRQYVVIACGGGKMGTKSGDAWMAFALPE